MATRMPIPAIHVILDQLYVERADAEAVMGLVAVIEVMRSSLPLASITLLGGSIPRKRTTSQTHIRGRPEWEWWNAVCAQIDVPVRYGDFGVVHPIAPAGGRGRQPHPFLHYTVSGQSLFVARKVRDRHRGAFAEAFAEVADELTDRPEYVGPGYSWGDNVLSRCRSVGRDSAGSSPKWIAMATSHHMAHLARHDDRPSGP